MKVPTLRPRSNTPAEIGTAFVPIAEEARNEAPRAGIDPDRSLSWLRRAMPALDWQLRKFLFSPGAILDQAAQPPGRNGSGLGLGNLSKRNGSGPGLGNLSKA